MNDRLHPGIALPPSVLDEPFLWPCPNETSFSYVARMVSVFPEYTSNKITQLIFGIRSSALNGFLHLGWGRFQDYLLRHGCDTDAIRHLSSLPIYRPFVESQNYANAVNIALTRHTGSCSPTFNTSSFRSTPAFCPYCVAADCRDRGYSWFRRTHLVAAVTCCPNHGCTLLDACPSCGEKLSVHNLPSLTCQKCGAPFSDVGSGTPAELAAARIAQAIYDGSLPLAPTALRLATLRSRVAERVGSRSGIVGDNLARQILRHFGRLRLNSLNCAPDEAPTFAWPMLLIHGLHFVTHLTANILLISMLFDSVEDYAKALERQRALAATEILKTPRPLIGACNITPAMLRAAYRHSIEDAAAFADGSHQRLRMWLRDYPGLSARRTSFISRQQLPRDRKILEAHIRQTPETSRTSVEQACKQPLRRIRNTDPAWLDRILPRKSRGRRPSKTQESVSSRNENRR
jgi:hypothetical protein